MRKTCPVRSQGGWTACAGVLYVCAGGMGEEQSLPPGVASVMHVLTHSLPSPQSSSRALVAVAACGLRQDLPAAADMHSVSQLLTQARTMS